MMDTDSLIPVHGSVQETPESGDQVMSASHSNSSFSGQSSGTRSRPQQQQQQSPLPLVAGHETEFLQTATDQCTGVSDEVTRRELLLAIQVAEMTLAATSPNFDQQVTVMATEAAQMAPRLVRHSTINDEDEVIPTNSGSAAADASSSLLSLVSHQ